MKQKSYMFLRILQLRQLLFTKLWAVSKHQSIVKSILRENRLIFRWNLLYSEGMNMGKRKLVLFTAVSLDGYIATEEHNLDWLFAVEGEGDNGVSRFYDTVDTLLIGRTTYDWIMEQENGEFPYKDRECYVFSRSEKGNTEYVTFTNEDTASFVERLKSKDGKNIWLVGGGVLLQSFLQERLLDEIIVTVAPIILGRGIPLFRDLDFQTSLSLREITRYNQFVELHYDVVKRKQPSAGSQ
jgi:dihydrofolate reductase